MYAPLKQIFFPYHKIFFPMNSKFIKKLACYSSLRRLYSREKGINLGGMPTSAEGTTDEPQNKPPPDVDVD